MLTQLISSGLPSQDVGANFWSWFNPFTYGWFKTLRGKIFVTRVVNKTANLKSVIERSEVQEIENSASAVSKLPKKKKKTKVMSKILM